jgi:hypothetical protein
MCDIYDRVRDLCVREIDERAQTIVAAQKRGKRGHLIVSCAICRELAIAAEELPKLRKLNAAALRARRWFERWGPWWGQPLPLNEHERERLYCGGYFHQHLVAHYSESLEGRDFDYLDHPEFFTYARGALAAGTAGAFGLTADEEIFAEFPPKRLPGLNAHGCWRPLPNRVSRILKLNSAVKPNVGC